MIKRQFHHHRQQPLPAPKPILIGNGSLLTAFLGGAMIKLTTLE
jgi:hypothetical protein